VVKLVTASVNVASWTSSLSCQSLAIRMSICLIYVDVSSMHDENTVGRKSHFDVNYC
jgi:hypothetical protein